MTEIPATVQALLGYIYSAEGPHGRMILERHKRARDKARKMGLIVGTPMKNGHRKAWRLTEAGRLAVENYRGAPTP